MTDPLRPSTTRKQHHARLDVSNKDPAVSTKADLQRNDPTVVMGDRFAKPPPRLPSANDVQQVTVDAPRVRLSDMVRAQEYAKPSAEVRRLAGRGDWNGVAHHFCGTANKQGSWANRLGDAARPDERIAGLERALTSVLDRLTKLMEHLSAGGSAALPATPPSSTPTAAQAEAPPNVVTMANSGNWSGTISALNTALVAQEPWATQLIEAIAEALARTTAPTTAATTNSTTGAMPPVTTPVQTSGYASGSPNPELNGPVTEADRIIPGLPGGIAAPSFGVDWNKQWGGITDPAFLALEGGTLKGDLGYGDVYGEPTIASQMRPGRYTGVELMNFMRQVPEQARLWFWDEMCGKGRGGNDLQQQFDFFMGNGDKKVGDHKRAQWINWWNDGPRGGFDAKTGTWSFTQDGKTYSGKLPGWDGSKYV